MRNTYSVWDQDLQVIAEYTYEYMHIAQAVKLNVPSMSIASDY